MPEGSRPPLGATAVAAAAGGFGGAVLGVIAATALMGNGDDNNGQSAVDMAKNSVEVTETRVASE